MQSFNSWDKTESYSSTKEKGGADKKLDSEKESNRRCTHKIRSKGRYLNTITENL